MTFTVGPARPGPGPGKLGPGAARSPQKYYLPGRARPGPARFRPHPARSAKYHRSPARPMGCGPARPAGRGPAVQDPSVYTANSRLTHEKALCEWFRNLSKRNVVRAKAAIVELHSDWLNRFTRTRGFVLGHPD